MMMAELVAVGLLFMLGSTWICVQYTIVSIGFSAGILQYQTMAIDAFRQRFQELTGLTVESYLKSLPVRTKLGARLSHDGPIQALRNAVRLVRGEPLLLTNERWIGILDALRTGPTFYITKDLHQRLTTVALYCACLPTNRVPSGSLRGAAFSGQRQAEFLVAPTLADIQAARTIDDLMRAYLLHRATARRKWFHAMTGGHRKILKAKATSQWIFWKRILAYSGGGGGVGTLVSLCFTALGHGQLPIALSLPTIGAGSGLFLAAVGIVKSLNRGRIPDEYRTPYRVFVKRQPLIGAGLVSGQVVLTMFAGLVVIVLVFTLLAFALSFTVGFMTGLAL
jgi:hypothetical protein